MTISGGEIAYFLFTCKKTFQSVVYPATMYLQKTNTVKNTVSEEEILSKTLNPKPKESSELQEILILLKSIEARVTKYIQEKSIFDE